MTRLEHLVTIERPLAEVYAMAAEVERYPEFLPGYLESRVLERGEDAWLLARTAIMRGKWYQWRSWVRFEKNQAIHFEQAEGPLKGMRVDWLFDAPHANQTRVMIIHRFALRRPPAIGWWMERLVFRPRIDEMAQQVVEALKRACEKRQEVLS